MKIPLKAISLNNMYSTGRGGKRFLTKRGREFKIAFQNWIIGAQFVYQMPTKTKYPVCVELVFCFKDKRKRDVDNMIKAVFDACTGVLWEDDSQVVAIYAEKRASEEDYIIIDVSIPTESGCKTCGHYYVH